jgi:hypothetical protein
MVQKATAEERKKAAIDKSLSSLRRSLSRLADDDIQNEDVRNRCR